MSLLSEEKKQRILDYVNLHGKATVRELSDMLEVSTESVRKYLEELHQDQKLKKVYGGAVKVTSILEESPHRTREVVRAEEKRRIGRYAAQLVEDNDVIVIDEGSTLLQMVPYLVEKKGLIVFTNSFPAASLLMHYANQQQFSGTLYFLGGSINAKHMRTEGGLAEKMMNSFYINKAFISCEGISLTHGVTCFSPEKGRLSRMMMEHAEESYILADSSKIGARNLYKMTDISDIHSIISDVPPPEEWKQSLLTCSVQWGHATHS